MGVDYDAICFYGVYFTYDEIKYLKDHPEFQKMKDEIGCNNLDNIWYEMGYITISPYYDSCEEDRLFCLGEMIEGHERWCRATGIKISPDDLKNWLDKQKDKVEKMVKDFCEKYSLKYIEPSFISFPSVC